MPANVPPLVRYALKPRMKRIEQMAEPYSKFAERKTTNYILSDDLLSQHICILYRYMRVLEKKETRKKKTLDSD